MSVTGCEIVTLLVAEHPLASVTVTVKVPAGRFVATAVICAGALFHQKV
jgi:hypothetical protein